MNIKCLSNIVKRTIVPFVLMLHLSTSLEGIVFTFYPIVLAGIVGKKWDPGILDPSGFSGQIRKVEARLGKLAKIRKVETD